MADAIIGAIVDVSLSKAISILEEQINFAWEFNDELNKLRAVLAVTHAFLQDAELRHLDLPLKVWLEQLSGIASEADDILDELAYEHLRKKVEKNQMRRKVSNFFSPSKYPMTFTVKMAKKVRKIMQSMEDINDLASKYGLQQRLSATASTGVGNQTHKFVESSKFIGRDEDAVKVADLLTSSTNGQPFSIVSIVGMAGLGKTALAKLVCNSDRVKNRFNKIIWVCVAENFDVQRILQEMAESLFGQTCELKNRNAILEKLKTELGGKTYLLVLDDVWNVKNWEDLRDSLLGINEDNEGCSILVTTRGNNFQETLPKNIYHLNALEDDDCWSLIKAREFTKSSISPELEAIGKDIARKCKGVPLVAAVIGGTMCHKIEKDEWVSIRDSSLWCSLEHDEAIKSVLKLSYDRLPSTSLKQCFVYCSIFPKDFCIQKEQLIQLWMAEGFLQQSKRNSMVVDEDIGNEYFKYLLSNSLLQDLELDAYGCISTCKMHDLIHDLAHSISEVRILTPENDSTHDIHKYKDDDSNEKVVDIDVKLWRSLFLKTDANHAAGIFNGLRVLKFCGARISSLPDSIGELKHLRYFDISRTDIRTIPKSLTELYHLQTLRLLMCYRLKKLPKGMKNLVSLRHLYLTYSSQFSAEIACLTSLKTLPIFDVGECGIGVLGNFSALGGELELSNLQSVRNKEEAREAKLWEKKKIHNLVYSWDARPFLKIDENKDEEVLDGLEPHSNLKSLWERKKIHKLVCSWDVRPFLKIDENKDEEVLDGLEPHSNLKSLTIKFYKGGQFPSWFGGMGVNGSLSNLVELDLFMCKSSSLPTLGQYLNLKFLRIFALQKVRRIGNEFYGTSDQNKTMFPSLEVFSLEIMEKLEEWLEVEAAAAEVPVSFPSLKELKIVHCGNLNSVPRLSRFSSLESLYLTDCSKLRWSTGDGPLLFPSSLRELRIESCSDLNCIPSFEGGMSSLQELYVGKCEKLRSIEKGLFASTVLRKASVLKCPSLTSICFSGFQTCTSLEHLCIRDCPNLKSIPGEILGSLTSLKRLELGGFSEDLEEFPAFSGPFLSSVIDLRLTGWGKVSSLPQQIQHFTALENLRIRKFHGMKALPEWLGNLSSLQSIGIRDCENLVFKEGKQRLFDLQEVDIFKWKRLKEIIQSLAED